MTDAPVPYCKPDSRINWYCRIKAKRRINSIVLNQGDIIEKVPKHVPIKTIGEDRILSEARYYDAVIVLTQSCDFEKDEENHYKEIDVVVCPIAPLNRFFIDDIEKYMPKAKEVHKYLESTKKPNLPEWVKNVSKENIKSFKKQLVKGHLTNYYLLDKCNWGIFKDDYIIVDFNGAFTVEIERLLKIISNSGERVRLQSPYNEGLSQSYGLKYMRVAQLIVIDKGKFENEKLPDSTLEIIDACFEGLKKVDMAK